MKKTILIGSVLILLALTAPLTVTQGLAVGDDYWFVVEQAYGDFEYDNGVVVNGSTDSFRVGSSSLAVDDKFRCEVDVISRHKRFKLKLGFNTHDLCYLSIHRNGYFR